MKKILCIISAVLCIFLTACGNDSSIGIIGGADDPASIKIAEEAKLHLEVLQNSVIPM